MKADIQPEPQPETVVAAVDAEAGLQAEIPELRVAVQAAPAETGAGIQTTNTESEEEPR